TPAGPVYPAGARDYFVLCTCGCVRSGYYDARPAERDIVCEACAERVQGRQRFAAFAVQALGGYRVER
ncbi:hypothetical protein ABTI40_19500, partial [Acinetobacter baumannii]